MWKAASIIFLLASLIQYYIVSQPLIPETYLTFQQLVKKQGYSTTEHAYPTEDGFILTAFRVFSSAPKGRPVLMLHGFSGAAENFIVNMHTKAVAFKLVDAGFDVWLLNSRGNTYSKNHNTLKPDSKEFWDWTVAEIGRYDIADSIKFIRDYTGEEKVALVGHSQGGTVMIGSLALNPSYEDSVSVAVSLAGTGGSFSNPSAVMQLFTAGPVIDLLEYFGIYTLLGTRSEFVSKLFKAFPLVAWAVTWDRFDISINNDDPESYAYYTSKTAGGTSTKNLRFIGSFFREDKKVHMPDYGTAKNLQIYETKVAPVLDYSRLKTKVAIMGGEFDRVITKDDCMHFKDQIPKEKLVFFKPDYHVDHLGFTLSREDSYVQDLIVVLKNSF